MSWPRFIPVIMVVVLGLVMASCGSETASLPSHTTSQVIPISDTPTPVPERPTLPPPSLSTVAIEPTTEPVEEPAAEPTMTPTVVLTVPVFLEPAVIVSPAPMENVTQPPYAESQCSDKYPCNDDITAWESRIQVLPGFEVSYLAMVDGKPTTITFGPDDLLYVAVQEGTIYTIDGEGRIIAYFSGLSFPTGLAFQPGTSKLFVTNRLENLNNGGEAEVAIIQGGEKRQLFGGIPCCYVGMHSANGLVFGPDGYGYVGVGARADHGEILPGLPNEGRQDELHPWEASILRFSPDGAVVESYAKGLRNPYDIVWDAENRLYATDNAPDHGPPDELHRVIRGGEHGYPWYDCDGCFSAPAGVNVIPPIYEFPPHSAVAGITAYLAEQFPGYYNNLFAVLWSAFPEAQQIVRLGPGGSGSATFAAGFAAPIDVVVGPDGSLYVADWATSIVFRISYVGLGDEGADS
jgi:hypothetical protein